MKDNFSGQALSYSKFRPVYPDDMVDYVCSTADKHKTALDLGTGNGQLALKLALRFEKVYGTDISQNQLDRAVVAPNLEYRKESAENTSFPDATFDMVTVAQAVHWFDFKHFYPEVYRILKPNGIMAILGYGLFSTNPRADGIIRHFYQDIIGPYWDKERKYLDENYKSIPFPFEDIAAPMFTADFIWEFEQLVGYLDSWSGVEHYRKKVGIDPIDLIRHELSLVWELSDKKVHFPMLLRLGRPFRQY